MKGDQCSSNEKGGWDGTTYPCVVMAIPMRRRHAVRLVTLTLTESIQNGINSEVLAKVGGALGAAGRARPGTMKGSQGNESKISGQEWPVKIRGRIEWGQRGRIPIQFPSDLGGGFINIIIIS